MSAITDEIVKFKDGEITYPDLKAFLVDYNYAEPTRRRTAPKGIDYDALVTWAEAANFCEQGTWDEVRDAMVTQLLTQDQFIDILGARIAKFSGE